MVFGERIGRVGIVVVVVVVDDDVGDGVAVFVGVVGEAVKWKLARRGSCCHRLHQERANARRTRAGCATVGGVGVGVGCAQRAGCRCGAVVTSAAARRSGGMNGTSWRGCIRVQLGMRGRRRCCQDLD